MHSLVLTDIASGWTEAAAMVVREQSLVTETVQGIRTRLPFPMLGLDVDNDSAFINETMLNYCREHQLELTRSRAYRKNDQAWIEQKNGAVIRKMVGYGRLEGLGAATILARLHDVVRLYVNYFQPCFKLKSKVREGAKVIKKYHAPATPAERLLASDRVSPDANSTFAMCLRLWIRWSCYGGYGKHSDNWPPSKSRARGLPLLAAQPDTSAFVASLSIAWQDGEIRPTHRKQRRKPRTWRTRADDFQEAWPTVERWLMDSPDTTAKDLFLRLQELTPDQFKHDQLRTLQRRVKAWRSEMVRHLIFGAGSESATNTSASTMIS